MNRFLACVAMVVWVITALPGCGGSKPPVTEMLSQNLLEVVASKPYLSTFMTLAKTAGIETLLSGNDPLTIFAPSNSAFDNLSKGDFDALTKPENKGQLLSVLKNHVISGSFSGSDLKGLDADPTNLLGTALPLSTDGQLAIGGANIVEADLAGANGVVHVVDRLIMP